MIVCLGGFGAIPKPSPALQPAGSCCGSLGWEHSARIQEIMLTPTPPKTPPLLGFVCQFRLSLVQILQPPLLGGIAPFHESEVVPWGDRLTVTRIVLACSIIIITCFAGDLETALSKKRSELECTGGKTNKDLD